MSFTINNGTPIQATAFRLTADLNEPDFLNLLFRLRDNLVGEIDPIDLRDAYFSVWSSIPFKLTNSGNLEYIGFDSDSYENFFESKKIYIGKKLLNNNSIMTQPLLDSQTDIFIYNTKPDNIGQIITRLNILSGSNNTDNSNSPFIQSAFISGATPSINFDFINNSGRVEVNELTSINGLTLPPGIDGQDGKFFTFNNGFGVWSDFTFDSPSTVGTSSSRFDIYGKPVKVNGYNLSFTDTRWAPIEIGDIKLGETFLDVNINDMLRRIIYNYLPPTVQIRILPPFSSGIAEIGTIPEVILEWTVSKKTNNISNIILSNMNPSFVAPIESTNYQIVTGTASGFIGIPLNAAGQNFSITANDSSTSVTSSVNIRGVVPLFFGFSTGIINPNDLEALDRVIQEPPQMTFILGTGSGNLFIAYDSSYGLLQSILEDGVETISGFTNSAVPILYRNFARTFRVYSKTFSTSKPVFFKIHF
jgi:hypothetical protein